MNRKMLIVGNWKMNKTGSEAVQTAKKLTVLCAKMEGVEVMIAPSYLSLPLVAKTFQNTMIKTGAQNLYFEKEGAFTGEISAVMIKATGANYVLIGHSERRQSFGETNASVCKKIQAAIGSGLKPILCIGETESQKNKEKTFVVLENQISDGLRGFDQEELTDLVIAYEPVWAIGTGKTASIEQVKEIHQYLRLLLEKLFSKDFADGIRILYGGSVTPANVKELMTIENVDGALVGGASLDADKFMQIIQSGIQF